MNYYYFNIQSNKIVRFNGEIEELLPGFNLWESSFGGDLYYKTSGSKITEIICEAENFTLAQNNVTLFLEGLT